MNGYTKRRRSRTPVASGIFDAPPIVRLWLLRLMILLGGHRQYLTDRGIGNFDDVSHALGLSEWIDREVDAKARRNLHAELVRRHREAEAQDAAAALPGHVAANVARIAELVGLSPVESRILEFAIVLRCDPMLSNATQLMGQRSGFHLEQVLSVLLNLNREEVAQALAPRGLLQRSGLLSLASSSIPFEAIFSFASEQFAERAYMVAMEPFDLVRGLLIEAGRAELVKADFAHLAEPVAILIPYLNQAFDNKQKGVNILLYGRPGTGKTQFAHMIAAELGRPLFAVASEDENGYLASGESRLRAFRAGQSLFSRHGALFLFDEAEDVFSGSLMAGAAAQNNKAWTNTMLEENRAPTFWLSNSIRFMDAAFIRRFDIVLEMPVPPRRQRLALLERTAGFLDAPQRERLAESEEVTPALVARAAAVVDTLGEALAGEQKAGAFGFLIDATLKAQRQKPLMKRDAFGNGDYDPALVSADADLAAIADGLTASRSGRLCLYGPPGTGKTAYGRWLAERLDMPLLVRRASDLLSKWVGGTEENIAATFEAAARDEALLMIDEIDSFLQDRRQAQQRWEVSQVNELLTQMESFSGVFIASTNLFGGLDQAVLRRFDLKVKFGFLDPGQIGLMLRKNCAALGLAAPVGEEAAALKRVDRLTPGDFAAILRRHRFQPLRTAQDFIEALEAECALKEGPPARIGFR